MTIKQALKTFLIEWYVGLYFISMGIMIAVVIHINKDNPEFIQQIQKGLPYDLSIFLLGIVVIFTGIQMLPIGKILSKSRTFQKWYIEYEQRKAMRKWRNDKK